MRERGERERERAKAEVLGGGNYIKVTSMNIYPVNKIIMGRP